MQIHDETEIEDRLPRRPAGANVSRRGLLQFTGAGAATLASLSLTTGAAFAQDTLVWDKTFPRSGKVNHEKVSFYNRLGINLVATMSIRFRRAPSCWSRAMSPIRTTSAKLLSAVRRSRKNSSSFRAPAMSTCTTG